MRARRCNCRAVRGPRMTTPPEGERGTYWSSIFFAAGPMQPGAIMLPATQGRPEGSDSGCPVSGSLMFRSVALSGGEVARCAAASVGTSAWLEPLSGRFQSRW